MLAEAPLYEEAELIVCREQLHQQMSEIKDNLRHCNGRRDDD